VIHNLKTLLFVALMFWPWLLAGVALGAVVAVCVGVCIWR